MIISSDFLPKRKLLCSLIGLAASVGIASTATAQEVNNNEEASQRTIEEILVTARRKEESAQEIPVAVTALSADAIYRQNINEIDDLNATVPGVNFTKSGSAVNTVFSIRGRSRGVFGNLAPSVNTYVNEVPLDTQGANLPTYDMSSLQVLKGPQGTLFGRNSTSGAVLATTQAPSHEFGGYVTAKVGEYSTRVLEGAVNIPIVQDKVALRIAGQLDERDGYTTDVLHPHLDKFGNHDRDNYRVSLLIEPTDNFSNLFVYEKNTVEERPEAIFGVGQARPGAVLAFPWTNGTGTFDQFFNFTPCNGAITCDVNAYLAQQEIAGPRKAYNDLAGRVDLEFESFSNTTTWDVGPFTLKNILGYRTLSAYTFTDIDGTPLALIHADNLVQRKQFTEEIQISGEALDGALDYIAGLFYLKAEPDGANRLALQTFAQSGTPVTNPYDPVVAAGFGGIDPFAGAQGPGDFYTDTSKAVFAQITYDLASLSDSLEGFSVDVGLRYTKDKAENCPVSGTSVSLPAPTESDCAQKVSEEFSKTTYNISLNYQVTDDVMLYATTRTGYRAGGVNSPIYGGTLTPYQFYEPEEVQDFELGMKSDWLLGDVAGRFNVALYYNDFQDVHYAIPTAALPDVDEDGNPFNNPSGGLFTGNAGDAEVKGIEIDLIANLTENLEVSVGAAYMERELDVSLDLPPALVPLAAAGQLATQQDIEAIVFLSAPDWSYNLNATYTLPLDSEVGEVALSARYFRMSEIQHGDGQAIGEETGTTDLRADWFGIMGSSFDAALYVTNVTDEEVLIAPAMSGGSVGINSGIYNEPRMWGASLRYSF